MVVARTTQGGCQEEKPGGDHHRVGARGATFDGGGGARPYIRSVPVGRGRIASRGTLRRPGDGAHERREEDWCHRNRQLSAKSAWPLPMTRRA